MKRLILIALVCAPMMMLAQDREGGAVKPGAKNGTEIDVKSNRYIYAEIVVTSGTGVSSSRINFGDNFKTLLADKNDIVQMEALKAKRYPSSIDALNAMNSEGFKVVSSYTTDSRQGTEAHIIMEKVNVAKGTAPGRPQRSGK